VTGRRVDPIAECDITTSNNNSYQVVTAREIQVGQMLDDEPICGREGGYISLILAPSWSESKFLPGSYPDTMGA